MNGWLPVVLTVWQCRPNYSPSPASPAAYCCGMHKKEWGVVVESNVQLEKACTMVGVQD